MPASASLTRPTDGSARSVAAWPVRQTLTRTAERLPEAIAIEGLGVCWTYRALARQVTQRRQAWAAAGLLPGQRLGIAATRSADTVVSILAALEHGLAYVPLDLSYPAERLQAMLQDAQVRAVVGDAEALQTLQGLVGEVPTLSKPAPAGPPPHADNGDLAYVLFTSGSTGRPKGVAMACAPLDHLIGWHVAHPRLGQAARTLQFAPLSFDVHFQEIVSTLATGGTLVLVADEARRDPARLRQALAEQRVSRLYLPYVALQMLAQADADAGHGAALALQDVVSAGEQLQITPDIRALFTRQPGAVLHNHYGPTESHVVTAHELDGPPEAWPQIPPIGRPLPHVAVRLRPVRDEDDAASPATQNAPAASAPADPSVGELLLGGDCLAEGYLGRADLSAERFLTVTDADVPTPGQASRWYVTGDLVRQDADGVLTYLGRADQQLKVDGFRIEPGDIELALMAHPGLQDAVVTAPQDPDGSRVLTAHVVLRPDADAAQPPVAEWRQWLRERLPEYMIPVRFAVLERLPTTPSGKIDRRGLPTAAPQAVADGHTDLRTRIRATWQELLGLPRLDDDAQLFDAGARSLLVMRFVARMKEAGIRLSVADVYDRPSVAGLTALATTGTTGQPGDADGAHADARRQVRAVPAGGHPQEGMAIVGMSLRVDDASDIDTFWDNLLRGKEAIRRFRPDELDPSVPEALRCQPNFVAARGVLEQADCFDAGFFGISAREARLMDPQQRLFLELCWTALEHAGIDPSRTPDRIGVYAGTANNAYLPAMRAEDPALIAQAGEFTAMLANEKDYVATRAAHRLDFHGPAVAIHSACSTSLVAIAHAWHALAQGQCEVALAGGVTVQVPQASGYLHVEGGMESADGRCRPFDAQASGTVFGSGGGVVVLKRLSQAQADGDTIYGVITGVGLNNDGGDKASFTAPSVAGQAQAIRMALAHAQVNARSIGYVEAHGTGTALGDPIEVAALSRAWSGDTRDTGYCLLGSIKGHVGHLVAAAGVLGLIKATLSLHRECVPGTLHFSQPNPQIDFASTPFHVSAQAQPWPRGQAPRRAAVSSFGVGGTNAHVILEEAPALASQPLATDPDGAALQLLPLSARHPQALQQRARDLALHLQRHPEQPLDAVAATLMRGRLAMPLRATVVAATHAEAIEALQALRPAQGNATALRAPRLVFLFPGQGSQHPGMARGLCEAFPAFREAFEACLDAAPPELAQTLRQLLTQARADDAQAAATLAETRHAQPALFAVSHALAAWLDSLGLQAQAMIGHSIGEYAAACHAGVMTVGDAMRAVIARGQAMFDQPGGAMLAVRTDVDTLRPLLPQGVDIAALNAPQLTVVAGPHAEIERLAGLLEARDIGVTRLKVSHAFHSASMDGALPRVEAALAQAHLQMPRGPQAAQPRLYSCVSGAPLQADEATDPAYWARQVRAPVAFSRAVLTEQAADQAGGPPLFIEVGPGQALTALVRQHRTAGAAAPVVVPLLMSAQQAAQGHTDPSRHALQALGQLWSLGADIAWPVPARSPRLALPTYPFLREVHWFTRSVTAAAMPLTSSATHTASHTAIAQTKPPAMNRLPRIEQEIARILSDVAGLPPESTQRDATFVDQGLDSLSLTQATLAFEQTFGIKLRFRRLLEDLDTLAKLAGFFDSQLPADKFAPAAAALPAASAPTSAAPMPALQPLPAAPGMDAGNVLQQMIQQQMQLMSQQLAVLSGQNLSLAGAPQLASAQVHVQAPPAAVIHAAPATHASTATTAMAGAEQPGKNALVEKPFGASARIELNAHNDITPAQQQWIDDFIRRYNARTGQSKAFSQQHRKVMADPRVVTGFNPLWKDLVYPIVADRSEGARIWDIDGNAYIDLLSCFGANFLGYKPADVTQAMAEQLERGIEVGPQHPMAAEVAQLISDITGMERVAFCNTGSEAVMGAMRIARTVTGRKKIAIFNNSYHGIFDEVIVRGTRQLRSLSAAPGILANAVENILVLDYDSPESLDVLRQCAHELAAIMIEPIQNKYPTLQPRAFVQQLREIATQGGAALIFDEVVTGFRVAPGGAQEFYGVRADIATYGKIIGGGLPFAAIAGGSLWLDALDGGHWQYGDDSYPEAGVTYFAGTFVRHPLALAAARATLRHLKRGGRALYDTVNARTQRMVERINAAFSARHAPVKAVHCASLWRLQWDDNTRHVSLFYYLARFRGLHLYEQFGHFVTEAMTDADCALIADTFTSVLDELMAQGLIAPRDGVALPTPSAVAAAPFSAPFSALAPGQTERWLAAIYDPAARLALNESFCVTLKGTVDTAALKQALQDVLQRHEAFKLSFELDQPRHTLHADAQVPVAEIDLRNWPDGDQALDQHAWQASATEFPLDQAPLARASILTLADGRVVVHVVASHLVFDGWASSVFNTELAQAYRARSQGHAPQWPAAASALRFAEAEHRRFDSTEGQASLAYWKQALQHLPAPVALGDKVPSGARTFAADTVRGRIDGERLAHLKELARSHEATLFQWLLHCVAELIADDSGQRDFVISIPYAAQSLERHAPLLADGVLDLPLRLQVREGEPARDHVRRIKSALMDAMEHPLMTQGTAARALGLQAEGSRPALTSVYFNLNPKVDLSGWAPLEAAMHEGRKRGLLGEVFFNFYEQADALTLDLHHSIEHLSAQRARQLVDRLLDRLVPAAATPALDTRLLSWNQTDRPLATPARVETWLSRQAQRSPGATAVVTHEGSLSYQQLESQSNRIARLLQNAGVGPGHRVGISLPRGRHLLPALLGVLKSGAAYVPMDPGFPTERLKMMAEDAGLTRIVTHSSCADASGLPQALQLQLDRDTAQLDALSDAPLPAHGDAEAPAYVIYTSGSTGRPKGVAVPHRAVCNFLASMLREPGLQASDRLLAVTTLSFDIAVLELLLPLHAGGTVVLATRDQAMDGEALMALAAQQGATVMQATPTTWHLLLDAGWQAPKGFRALVGGEPLPAALAGALLAKGCDVWNMYGPTETTVWSTLSHVTDPAAKICIGRPIDNTQVWILDEALQPLPIGAEGEICIGGDGVALGYHGRPDLTAERFVRLPWGPRTGQLVYRTGDLGRWREDGQIEHLGRMDFQVKIRGYRIELGEIEAQLEKQAGVSRAVVVACEVTPGDMALIAYAVPSAGSALDTAALRTALRQTLPDYMVPRSVLALPSLPLLPNNKVDRKALPLPTAGMAPSPAAAAPAQAAPLQGASPAASGPAAQAIDTVAREMGQLLGRERLGETEHFFEQGGHSLMAAKLSAQLAKALGQRPGLRLIFDNPSPRQLGQALWQLNADRARQGGPSASAADTIPIRADQSTAPLSQMQERVWFLENLTPGTVVHSIPTGHRLLGPLNVEAFNRAWQMLVQRQSVLRTVIERGPQGDVQRILPELPFSLIPFDDFSHLPPDDRKTAMNKVIAQLVETPYELEKGPLFTARLFRLSEEEHGLLFQAHHLIWDAWSFDLLYVDLPELYSACLENRPPKLPALTVSYGDFAAWHNEWMTGPELQRQLGYWREQLTPLPPPLAFPIDHPRPAVMSGRGGSFQFNLAKDVTDALRAQAQQHGRTLYITLLAAYALALHRVSQQDDFVIGTPVRGREQPALEHLMGFFVNMLPLRMRPRPDMALHDWLNAVHRKVVDAFSYPDVPFDHLVHVMQVPRDRSRPPIHQVSFSYQDVRERTTRWGNVDHQRMPTPMLGAAQDLALWCVETRNHIEFVFTFNADVLETSSVGHFARSLEQLLRDFVTDPDRPLSGYDFSPGSLPAAAAPAAAPAPSPAPAPAATSASLEASIADVWRGLLGLAQFGLDDNFFDRGGHSLLVMRAVTQIRTRTGQSISVHAIFDNPTPRRLAQVLGGHADLAPTAAPSSAPAGTALVVPHRAEQDTAPLSQMQQRVWYLENLTPHGVAHHIPSAHRLVGPLDAQALSQAWQQLVARQSALRTVIERTPTGDRQRILPQLETSLLPLEDLGTLAPGAREAALRTRINALSHAPFDLEHGPLFAIRLFKLTEQDHVLFLLVHHLIWDGWSFQVLNDELSELYAAALAGRPAALPPLAVSHGDFAAWHNQWMSGEELQRQTAFWQEQLSPLPAPLALPLDHPRPAVMSGEGASLVFRLAPQTTRVLRTAAQSQGRTLFTTLLGAFGLLLHKLTGQDDLVIGTPVRGRDHPELESLIGFFVNTLPVRLRPRDDLTVSEWLAHVQRHMIDALSHPDVPLDHLVRTLRPPRDTSRSTLYQALFSYQDARERSSTWGNVQHLRHDLPMVGAAQDLALWCVETPEDIEFTLSYDTGILGQATVQLFAERLSDLLQRLASLSDTRLLNVSVQCPAEAQALRQWNDTATPWPACANVVDLLRQATHCQGSDIALSQSGERPLSHAEVWARARQIAHQLRAQGIGRGALVGVCMPRCPDLLTSVLGVLLAGAAYVPLDPAYPSERLACMADDARLAWVISRSDAMQALRWPRDKTLLTDLDDALLQQQPATPLAPASQADATLADPAYVIYTSGSTGKPKGVVVPHGAVVNFLRSMAAQPGLQAHQRLLAVTTLSFDISVLELFLPLLVGAEIVLCSSEDTRDPFMLKTLIEDGIDVMQATPSTWHALIDAGWQGRPGFTALVGGETLSPRLAGELLARCDAVWNMYGPTETTVWSTCWRVSQGDGGVRIGRPIANTQAHILDERGQPCPVGIPGELCIGGDGVSSGYLYRPELTAERFVRDTFRSQPEARLYRTGDLARWCPDGELEHLGRLDHQVKVRGHRIELGEIEAALLAFAAIGQAVVVTREDQPGDVRLVAYGVPRDRQAPPELQTLKAHLAQHLPDHMLPQHIVLLDELPRLPNGKIDRNALPRPAEAASSASANHLDRRLPVTPQEKAMAEVWQELLDTQDIGLDDNFFNLGGHSLLAMRAVTEIKRRTGLTLHVRRLIFETLGQLAAVQDAAQATAQAEGLPPDAPAHAPQTPPSRGGWLGRWLGR